MVAFIEDAAVLPECIPSDGARFQSYSTVGIQKDQMEIMQISRAIFDEVAKTYN